MNITNKSLNHPVSTLMIFLCFIVIGFISSRLLPLEFFPDMDFPGIFVNVPYPGSTPEEVELRITRPIEEVLATISGIKQMNSNSSESQAFIFIRFDWGTNTGVKAIEAKEKIDSIRNQLPRDVERIIIEQRSASDIPILTVRLSSNRDLSQYYDMLNRLLKRPLERLGGVSRVTMYGAEKKEIRIQLIADRITAHQVDLEKLSETLRRDNFIVTAGTISDLNRRYRVRPMGEFNSLEEYEELIVGDNNLRLKDIATVSYERPRLTFGRHLDRKYAVGLDIFKEAGANTVTTADAVKNELDRIGKDSRMEGIAIFFMEDASQGIVDSLSELLKSGLFGAALATILLFFFLRRWSTTFIVVLAVPFSILVTLALMYFFNLSLNILSMMGLMLAIGMLVDNSVVVTESIHRHQLLHEDQRKASLNGVKEVALAITAGTLTTVIVFLPTIIATNDEVSIYMKHVAITFTIALLASLLMSQTVVPLLASIIKLPRNEVKTPLIDKMIKQYGRILDWILLRRKLSVIFIILIILSAAIPFSLVKQDMFEEPEDRRMRIFFNMNGNYTLEKIESAVYEVEDYLFKNKEKFEIDSVYTYYDMGYAESTIILKKGKEAHRPQEKIIADIQAGIPKIAVARLTFERSRGMAGGEQLNIFLRGDSSSRLAELSRDVTRVLSNIQGIKDVRSDAELGDQEVQVVVDRKKAGKLGLSSSQIANMVSVAMRGQNLRRFHDEHGEIEVRVEFQRGDKQTLEDIQNLVIYDSRNTPLKLSTLADFNIRRGPRNIRRENRVTSLGISMNLKGITVNEASDKIAKVMNNYRLPAGYTWSFGRSFNYEDEAAMNMLISTLLALFLVYFILASLFESIIFPAAMWSSIIFAIVGVWWFFLITGTVFSIMAWIGILILIGVVVNNGIVLIDHINRFRENGYNRHDAIVNAGMERIRPILMTAGTTIMSLIPLSIGMSQVGGDGPPYYPMARAIVGGLTFSTLVTLLILPRVYVLLDDYRVWVRRVVRQAFEKSKKPIFKKVEKREV